MRSNNNLRPYGIFLEVVSDPVRWNRYCYLCISVESFLSRFFRQSKILCRDPSNIDLFIDLFQSYVT